MLNAAIAIFVKILPILWSFRGESRGLGILSVAPFAIFLPSCQPLSWTGSFVSRKSHKPARTRKFKLHHHRLSRTRLSFIRLVGSPFPIETNPTSMPVGTFFRFLLDGISSSYYVSNGRNSPGRVASSFFNFIARRISFASFAAESTANDTSGIIPVMRS